MRPFLDWQRYVAFIFSSFCVVLYFEQPRLLLYYSSYGWNSSFERNPAIMQEASKEIVLYAFAILIFIIFRTLCNMRRFLCFTAVSYQTHRLTPSWKPLLNLKD
jgi:hypothetical protein